MKKLLLILIALFPGFMSTVVFGGQHSGLGGGVPPAPPPPVDPKLESSRNISGSSPLADWIKEQLEILMQASEIEK